MSTIVHTEKQYKVIRYYGGRKTGPCLDIIPSKYGTKINIKSIKKAESMINFLEEFITYRKKCEHQPKP